MKSEELRLALAADVNGIVDDEGRSALDFLLTEVNSASARARNEWTVVAIALITSMDNKPTGWWQALERFVVLGDLECKALAEAIENAAAEKPILNALDRASMYDLLDASGKPPLASRIMADEDLKNQAPLRWLDLMLARLPSQVEGQHLVLEAVRSRYFLLPEFIQRLDEMRSLGGAQLGDLACTRFRRHRVRCFYGTGGESWRGEDLRESSSLRRCG